MIIYLESLADAKHPLLGFQKGRYARNGPFPLKTAFSWFIQHNGRNSLQI